MKALNRHVSQFEFNSQTQVFAYDEPINMCKSFDGLSELVKKKLKRDVLGGDIFLFFNKRANYCKAIWWQDGGLCIFSKKIKVGAFDIGSLRKKFTGRELSRLVKGFIADDAVELKKAA